MKTLASILFFLSLSACSPKILRTIDADLLLVNGAIWTADTPHTTARALAVKDGNIVFIGDTPNEAITANQTVDLKGKFLMPGFIDNHVHFLDGGFGLASVDLRNANTPELFSSKITNHANTLDSGRWVLIGAWDHTLWGGTLPDKQWIDQGTANTPVFVMRLDGHMALANSAALKLAGIDKDTPTPKGGEIIRDANGEPTGLLKDSAMLLVQRVIPAPSETELLHAMELAQDRAFSVGVTQVHAMSGNPDETKILDAFILARDRGRLKIRANVYTPIEHWQSARAMLDENGAGDELLRWGGVKGLVDGSLGSATAWFHTPYSDDDNNRGFPLIEPENLVNLLTQADRAELKLAIHAIGDKAIDNLIDAFEKTAPNQVASKRFRIEHFQHPSAAAIKRLGQLGIIAAAHPYHAIDDGRWAEGKIGADRIKTTYAFRSILDAGGILSFGSDWPVAPIAPLHGVYAAVTRQTLDGKHPDGWQPHEKITVEEALLAYTLNNAYAGFEENRAGSLAVGKRADFVMLDSDPRAVAAEQIKNIKVLATIIGGETVYGGL